MPVRDGLQENTQGKNSGERENSPAVISFESVYRTCGEKILNLAYRFTRDEEVARDLTQDIFIKVHQNLNSFREEAQVTTWVYRIAVNHCLNYLKQAQRKRWNSILDRRIGDALYDETETVSPDPEPDRLVEFAERDRIIHKAVESLSPKYRMPFQLYRDEEMSYEEIARAMNISLSAVETRIHRAKKQLIKALQPWRDLI